MIISRLLMDINNVHPGIIHKLHTLRISVILKILASSGIIVYSMMKVFLDIIVPLDTIVHLGKNVYSKVQIYLSVAVRLDLIVIFTVHVHSKKNAILIHLVLLDQDVFLDPSVNLMDGVSLKVIANLEIIVHF